MFQVPVVKTLTMGAVPKRAIRSSNEPAHQGGIDSLPREKISRQDGCGVVDTTRSVACSQRGHVGSVDRGSVFSGSAGGNSIAPAAYGRLAAFMSAAQRCW